MTIANGNLGKTKPGKRWYLRATVVFILGLFASWYFIKTPIATLSGKSVNNIIETPRGSQATIQLPDGSKVVLNAESKITYPQEFSDQERKVLLEGEAFFDIKKDPNRQFLVKTKDITVKVFGTSFNVKSYPYENTTETTLVEGSISIYKNSTNGDIIGSELKMNPNQRIVLYKEPQNSTPSKSQPKKKITMPQRKPKLVLSKHIDTDRYISWRKGRLKIESEPMKKLAQILERRYDVKIHFMDEDIKQIRYSGTFENETIEQVMEALKLASLIDYKIDEREIWISSNGN